MTRDQQFLLRHRTTRRSAAAIRETALVALSAVESEVRRRAEDLLNGLPAEWVASPRGQATLIAAIRSEAQPAIDRALAGVATDPLPESAEVEIANIGALIAEATAPVQAPPYVESEEALVASEWAPPPPRGSPDTLVTLQLVASLASAPNAPSPRP